MINDYSEYVFSGKERLTFYSAGYMFMFAVTYLFYHSLIISLLSGIMIHWVMPYIKKYMAGRRMNMLNEQFKDMLYSLAASVAAGRHMSEAIIEAEENLAMMYSSNDLIMKELKHMRISMTQNKESDKVLLKDFAFRSRNEDITDFYEVYDICRSMGGDLEKVIRHTTEMISDKMTIEREIRTITIQKKVEGRIISAMPLVMLLMLNIVSYSYISPLYTSAAGRIIMTAAFGAMIYGTYIMEKISDIKV